MEVLNMLYISIENEEEGKLNYSRNAVIDELLLEDGVQESENIKLDFSEDGKKLKLVSTSEDEASSSDYLIVNRIGLYKNIVTNLDILFLDENTMLVNVDSGCVFIRSEFKPSKKPTFALTRDAEAIERQEVDMVAMLDTTGSVVSVNSDNVHWVSAKDIYNLIKSTSNGGGFGLYSNIFTMDYYYSVELTCSVSMDKSREHIQTGYKIVPTGNLDLSYGKVDEWEIKEQEHKKRVEKLEWDKKMEEQRRILERAKNYSYFEEDDDYIDEDILDMLDENDMY